MGKTNKIRVMKDLNELDVRIETIKRSNASRKISESIKQNCLFT